MQNNNKQQLTRAVWLIATTTTTTTSWSTMVGAGVVTISAKSLWATVGGFVSGAVVHWPTTTTAGTSGAVRLHDLAHQCRESVLLAPHCLTRGRIAVGHNGKEHQKETGKLQHFVDGVVMLKVEEDKLVPSSCSRQCCFIRGHLSVHSGSAESISPLADTLNLWGIFSRQELICVSNKLFAGKL